MTPDLLGAFELHSVEQIRAALDAGGDPRAPLRGRSLVNWLTEMYSRGDRFLPNRYLHPKGV